MNKSTNAHEQFVLLNEAYEYLINVDSVGTQSSSSNHQWSEQDWQEQQREYAKERAREYARMRYAEFIKSDYYKEQQVVETVTTHLNLLVSVLLLTVFPIVMISIMGIEAIIGVVVVNIILMGFHILAYRNIKKISIKDFSNSIFKFIQIKTFQVIVLLIVNLILFFTTVINTLATISFLFSAYSIAILLFLVLFRNNKTRKFLSFAVAPTLISLLFFVNFAFASYPTQERFKIVSSGYSQETSMITFENGQLDKYPGIRIFYDYQQVRFANEVEYTFEYGFLGLMVMTDYYLK